MHGDVFHSLEDSAVSTSELFPSSWSLHPTRDNPDYRAVPSSGFWSGLINLSREPTEDIIQQLSVADNPGDF